MTTYSWDVDSRMPLNFISITEPFASKLNVSPKPSVRTSLEISDPFIDISCNIKFIEIYSFL
jgi:hypothetical protein